MTVPAGALQQTGDVDLTQGPTLRDAKSLSPEERARIRRNVEKMQAAKAPASDIEAYLRDHERLAPQGTLRETPVRSGTPGVAPRPASTAEQLLAAGNKGATFGFSDELLGAAGALVTPSSYTGHFGENYRNDRDEIRGIGRQASEEHPVASKVAEIGGGIVSALPVAGAEIAGRTVAGPALTVGKQVAQGVKSGVGYGAGYGAVAGAGNADGTLKERAAGAAEGGATGAVLGGALGALTPLGANAISALKDLVGRRQIAAGTKAAADAREAVLSSITDPQERQAIEGYIANDPILSKAFGKARTGAIGNLGPLGGATSPLRPNLPRTQPDASFVQSADDRANEKLLQVLNRDNQTPASLRAASQTARAEGNTPLNLMDLSGENAQGLGRAARATPSTAKNLIPKVLEARGKEAESRVIGKLIETTGQGRRINLSQSIDQMAEERAKDAEKLYAPIRDQVVDTPEIADALHMKPMEKAYERARAIATNKAGAAKLRKAGDGTASLPPYEQLFDENGALKKPLTLGQLDQIKRGLDDMLETSQRSPADAGGLGNEGMGSLRDLKNAYVSVLDAAVPDYAKARQTFAGHSAMIRAFEQGQKLFTKSPDEMTAALGEMSQAEQDAFRKGAVEALSQKIEGVTPGNSLSLRVADKTRDQQRLRLLFPDEQSYTAFRQSVAQEALAHLTKKNVLGNSSTIDKLAEFADLSGVDLGAVMKGVAEPGGITKYLQIGARKLAERSMESKADALAPKLLASGKSLEDVIASLQAASDRLAKSQAQRTARSSATAAGLTGSTQSPPRKR